MAKKISLELASQLMDEALAEADKAEKLGEVPIGAVIYHSGSIVARSHNLIETNRDASQHAEVIAIQNASKALGDWRLQDSILCVTLEPCPMCAGLIRLSRIGTLIFGAYDPRQGAVGSLFNLAEDPRLGKLPQVLSSIREAECSGKLTSFFKRVRKE